MLNGRIYRAAFLPLLLALAIAGFSLSDRPAPLGSNLAPDAFQGTRAFAELESLSAHFSDVRPGSVGDRELAAQIAAGLRALGATSGGGFTVSLHSLSAQTIAGQRTLTTVIAQRPGSTGEPPIAILAHRDAAHVPARDELVATAILLELARDFAASQTHRGIVLVSTSGGSGGDAGARDFAAHAAQWIGGPIDAAIVLGDLAGSGAPHLAPFSATPGSASQLLQRTVAQALAQQAGLAPSSPTLIDTLGQLTFPLVAGEQGPLDARGIPAVLLQGDGSQDTRTQNAGGSSGSGEFPPPPDAPLSAARLEGLGRAVLAAVYALDAGPEVAAAGGVESSLPVHHKLLPAWAVRLLVAALLLPPLLTAGDGLARLRRRRPRAERSLRRSIAWVAACGLPFLACALFARLLGALGVLPAPYPPVAPGAAPLHGAALEAVLAVALAFLLAWLTWPTLMRRLRLPIRPGVGAGVEVGGGLAGAGAAAAGLGTGAGDADVAPLALLLVLSALAVVVWALDPYTALLLLPALHLWLALADREQPLSRSPLARLALVALGAAPLVLLIAFYAQRFGFGLGDVAHTALLLLAGGRVGLAGAVLWSVAFGCFAAALLIALAPSGARFSGPSDPGEDVADGPTLTIRGPMSYAGPGSLGGTESALRR